MESKTIVVTRPDHDLTMRYISHWAQAVIKEAQKKSHRVIDLKSKRANQKEFESIVKKKRPEIVFLNGHGSSKAVRGQDNQALVEAGTNEQVLRNTITYALSCKSAVGLGPASVKAGARAYIGYKDEFIFMLDKPKQTKPQHDKTAKLFLEPSSRIPMSLLKGRSVKEACERGRSAFRRSMRKLLTSEVVTDDSSLLRFLFWDMQHLVAHGDEEAVL